MTEGNPFGTVQIARQGEADAPEEVPLGDKVSDDL